MFRRRQTARFFLRSRARWMSLVRHAQIQRVSRELPGSVGVSGGSCAHVIPDRAQDTAHSIACPAPHVPALIVVRAVWLRRPVRDVFLTRTRSPTNSGKSAGWLPACRATEGQLRMLRAGKRSSRNARSTGFTQSRLSPRRREHSLMVRRRQLAGFPLMHDAEELGMHVRPTSRLVEKSVPLPATRIIGLSRWHR